MLGGMQYLNTGMANQFWLSFSHHYPFFLFLNICHLGYITSSHTPIMTSASLNRTASLATLAIVYVHVEEEIYIQ